MGKKSRAKRERRARGEKRTLVKREPVRSVLPKRKKRSPEEERELTIWHLMNDALRGSVHECQSWLYSISFTRRGKEYGWVGVHCAEDHEGPDNLDMPKAAMEVAVYANSSYSRDEIEIKSFDAVHLVAPDDVLALSTDEEYEQIETDVRGRIERFLEQRNNL